MTSNTSLTAAFAMSGVTATVVVGASVVEDSGSTVVLVVDTVLLDVVVPSTAAEDASPPPSRIWATTAPAVSPTRATTTTAQVGTTRRFNHEPGEAGGVCEEPRRGDAATLRSSPTSASPGSTVQGL